MANALSEIIMAVVVILAIFGVIYMLTDIIMGVTITVVCGFLILIRAFIEKHTGGR